ncbi:MAG TPA: Hsp20/alpha crystallin family protein [Acidimicrobiales bacterium]|nr:Hsp20/alpha crystallin family protein [Acidimicrobiales bacterium]
MTSSRSPMDGQQVPVNMYETEGAVVVVAPFPGVMEDDVVVKLDGRTLTLRAEMRTAAQKDYLLHEWHYGPWERTLEIPEGFGDRFETSFGNGQLAVRVLRSS